MNRLCSGPAWTAFWQKLQERHCHLTSADLDSIEKDSAECLYMLQRLTGRSLMELAHLAEGALESLSPGIQLARPPFARSEQ